MSTFGSGWTTGILWDLSSKWFRTRILYDAASNLSARVSTSLNATGWQFPHAVSRELQLICNERPDYIPNVIQEDTVTWLLTSHGNFTVKSAWNAFRELRRG